MPGKKNITRKRLTVRRIRQRWESLCKRCGACCFEKKESGLFRVSTDYSSPCEYLDDETMMCTVYERRFAVCKDCRRMTILHALFASYLPKTCGYVEYFRKKRAHV